MAKDPAVLFYTSDFIVGTAFLSHEQVGKYIRLLCYQHQAGRMTKEQVLKVIGNWDQEIMDKFCFEEGLYYNSRMESESDRRKAFCESRRLSRMSNVRKTHVEHTSVRMETETTTENNNKATNIKEGIVKGNPKDLYLSTVYLTKEEHTKLIERFGEEGVKQRIYDLNNGIMSKGYKYRSHYHTILSWERRHERLKVA